MACKCLKTLLPAVLAGTMLAALAEPVRAADWHLYGSIHVGSPHWGFRYGGRSYYYGGGYYAPTSYVTYPSYYQPYYYSPGPSYYYYGPGYYGGYTRPYYYRPYRPQRRYLRFPDDFPRYPNF